MVVGGSFCLPVSLGSPMVVSDDTPLKKIFQLKKISLQVERL